MAYHNIIWSKGLYERTPYMLEEMEGIDPIGLDLHTPIWLINGSISSKLDYYQHIRDRNIPYQTTKIFCDAQLSLTSQERIRMFNTLRRNPHVQFLNNRVPFREIVQMYRSFKFVLSPPGNGLDCHRTWELFLLGCIVITKTSSLDDMWRANNLPVVILQDWDELNEDIEGKLREWYSQYEHFTRREHILPKFTNDYWLR